MMWKKKLESFENEKKWLPAIELMQQTIKNHPDDVEAHIRIIYLLHNILLEEDYPKSMYGTISSLLLACFQNSKDKFSNNAEYLFFVGKILYIAEWYFAINDDSKQIEEMYAFKMQKKAHDIEPENILFEWAYRYSLKDNIAQYLAHKILNNGNIVKWLNSKGFPGEYMLNSLKKSEARYSKL